MGLTSPGKQRTLPHTCERMVFAARNATDVMTLQRLEPSRRPDVRRLKPAGVSWRKPLDTRGVMTSSDFLCGKSFPVLLRVTLVSPCDVVESRWSEREGEVVQENLASGVNIQFVIIVTLPFSWEAPRLAASNAGVFRLCCRIQLISG